jgi:hypothetical protein
VSSSHFLKCWWNRLVLLPTLLLSEWSLPKIDDTGLNIPSKSSETFTNISWTYQCVSLYAHFECSSSGSDWWRQSSTSCLVVIAISYVRAQVWRHLLS